MERFSKLSEKIKTIKYARDILQKEYQESEFHKKKEANPQDTVPHSPEDEEIYKLLIAIQQLDFYLKKLQNKQFQILKENE